MEPTSMISTDDVPTDQCPVMQEPEEKTTLSQIDALQSGQKSPEDGIADLTILAAKKACYAENIAKHRDFRNAFLKDNQKASQGLNDLAAFMQAVTGLFLPTGQQLDNPKQLELIQKGIYANLASNQAFISNLPFILDLLFWGSKEIKEKLFTDQTQNKFIWNLVQRLEDKSVNAEAKAGVISLLNEWVIYNHSNRVKGFDSNENTISSLNKTADEENINAIAGIEKMIVENLFLITTEQDIDNEFADDDYSLRTDEIDKESRRIEEVLNSKEAKIKLKQRAQQVKYLLTEDLKDEEDEDGDIMKLKDIAKQEIENLKDAIVQKEEELRDLKDKVKDIEEQKEEPSVNASEADTYGEDDEQKHLIDRIEALEQEIDEAAQRLDEVQKGPGKYPGGIAGEKDKEIDDLKQELEDQKAKAVAEDGRDKQEVIDELGDKLK
ncbi:MAG: hypothetical protein EZS28_025538, partial [Streblomastix strix]